VIFGFLKRSPEKQARELNKDAGNIVEMAEQTYRTDLNEQIANLTRDSIEQISSHCGSDQDCQAHEIERYKILHREARRKASQVGLTAYTLIIIHTRSLPLGNLGAPARQAIDEFCQRWPGNPETSGKPTVDEGTLAG
jgi:hypothetical protein